MVGGYVSWWEGMCTDPCRLSSWKGPFCTNPCQLVGGQLESDSRHILRMAFHCSAVVAFTCAAPRPGDVLRSICHPVDGCEIHFAPAKKHWKDDSPEYINKQMASHVFGWQKLKQHLNIACSVHPRWGRRIWCFSRETPSDCWFP